MLQHPGADAHCSVCHGLGIKVRRAGAFCEATPCDCVGSCPVCRGSRFVAVGDGFRAPRRRCDCARVEGRMRMFNDVRIPGRYHEATLANFHVTKGQGPAFVTANTYVTRFRAGEENRGLILNGKVGRGKTHLMIGILKELVFRYGVSARFVEFSHLLADLKVSFDRRHGAADLLEPLSRVHVLAIDELGKGRNTAFEGTVLDEIVSRRYNASATILATTNFEPGPSSGHETVNLANPSDTAPRLVDRVGDRVYSRLREVCDFVPVHGDDYRELSRLTRRPSRR